MRVTQGMINNQMLRNLNSNLSRLEKLQNQMSTGRRINKPSDDPVGIGFSLRFRSGIEANQQYQRNVDAAISWTDHIDKMIGEVNDVLQRARELAVQGANGTNPDFSSASIAKEIDQLYQHLVDVGNTEFNGKYIFNGQLTDKKPYEIGNAENVTPHQGVIPIEIGIGVTIQVNISGADLFGSATDMTNAFKVLIDLRDALLVNDKVTIQDSLGKIDQRMDTVLVKWAEVGARSNRIELVQNRLKDESINLHALLSSTEDADMAELMINMKTEENIYQASLSTGARIIRPSLVDFLR